MGRSKSQSGGWIQQSKEKMIIPDVEDFWTEVCSSEWTSDEILEIYVEISFIVNFLLFSSCRWSATSLDRAKRACTTVKSNTRLNIMREKDSHRWLKLQWHQG